MSDLRFDADNLNRQWLRGSHHGECGWCACSAPLRFVHVPDANPDDMSAGLMCLGCFVEHSAYDLAPAPEVRR